MRHRLTSRSTARATAIGAALTLAAGAALSAAPAQAADNTSLAEVLAADGNHFDRNWDDFDVVERAVLKVLSEKPDSAVGVLADPDVALTAFVPTDRAFRRLVADLTGVQKPFERGVWSTAKTLGVDTLETVLLYHVVPGSTIKYSQALGADGAELTTAQGGKVTVQVRNHRVRLADLDRDDRNARVIPALRNINKGNPQIAHGVDEVLRPANL
ncbi:fasciclin domain-containing protein [Nocardioides mesophilus]|uniref:Fasciclin domain-containing protein n=1 Tax=Nocardioides mesophilus TaxID=433659 RepID=A0A7G9RDV9_9ACTN|nr:fasciclin domain-containing protein [Nocardioides mesophilus]QNN53784.1 fasciclin domain-containing protein [Nocardioides mesophilus]